MPPFSPRTLATNGSSFSRTSPSSMTADDRRHGPSTSRRGELVERRQHGGAAERVGAPGVGAFAVVEAGEQVAPADRRRDRHAVAQALAEHDDVRLQAVGLEGEQVAGAAEVRLHLVEDEDDVVLAAELPAAVCRYALGG